MLQCVAVSREIFYAKLFSATGDVAAFETEPEIGGEVAVGAVLETDRGVMRRESVGELLQEEGMFAGTEVEGEGLDVRLTGHSLCGQHSGDNSG